ncbi:DNA repair protein RadC (plasmid) [Brevundimonas staleyi]|uniref:DNA repair protein RadC n=1 Tax=Brevundimonas staleyi TaxID=74326 RepID=A0ABW0FNZ2_9CAUL
MPNPRLKLVAPPDDAVLLGRPMAAPRHARLRARALRSGARSLTESDVLEILLGARDPYRAAPMAEALLHRFGGLVRVLAASAAELGALVGPQAAADLLLVHDIARRLLEFPIRERCLLTSHAGVKAYLRHSLAGQSRETLRVLYLDGANRLIADEAGSEGTVNHAPVYPREIMRRALELGAVGCVLVHNHPSGSASPSRADIEITAQVVAAGRALGIAVHDHMLVAGDTVVSFRDQGLMG